MHKENYTILLTLEILFLSFFATAICLSFDLWQPAGGALPIQGTNIWEDHSSHLERPVSWTQNLREYYACQPTQTHPFRWVRLALSLFPWTFFGLAICQAVYGYIKKNEISDPFTSGLSAARRLLPFWLGGALSIGFSIGLWILYKLQPDTAGNPAEPISIFYICVLGFGIAFLINLIYLAVRFAQKAYQKWLEEGNAPLNFWNRNRWLCAWIIWRMFEGVLAGIFAYIPMLVLAMICHGIIGTLVFGFAPWVPLRKEAATMAALSFIPMVVLNGFFWTAAAWMYIRIRDANKSDDF